MAGTPLWTGWDVAAIVGGRWLPARFGATPIHDVGYRPEDARPGCLFFVADRDAWGARFTATDRDLAATARAGPAAVVVTARALDGAGATAPPLPALVVENTYTALRALAAAARERFAGKVVAVTGTSGKTSTCRMLARVLAPQGATATTLGNMNFGPGLWTALCRAPRDAHFGVYELGMLGPGSIAPKARLVRPDVAVITALGTARLEHHAGIESIVATKAGIVEGLVPGGTLVAPRDTPWFDTLAARAAAQGVAVLGFGAHAAADVRLVAADCGAAGSRFAALVAGRPVEASLTVPGRHFVDDALAVLGTVHALGADVARAAADLGAWQPPAGRGAVETLQMPVGPIRLIDHSFNANPDSMAAALDVLGLVAPAPGGRRLAVLADMLELGAPSAALHRDLAEPLERAGVDRVFTFGTHVAALRDALPAERLADHAKDLDELEAALAATLRGGDVVLVKGSQATGLAGLVQRLKAAARRSALLLDARTGAVLFEQAADAPRPPASLAKLMTLYLAFKALDDGRLDLASPIRISANAARPIRGSARLGCAAGETITGAEAIAGLVVASANDVAVALAEHLCGSEAAFAGLMNAPAAAMGLAVTHFANASGLSHADNRTTAREMAALALRLAEDFPHRLGAFAEPAFVFKGRRLPARNRLLGRYEGLVGMKTGHLPSAGYHLVALAERGPRRLLSVVLGAASEDDRDARTAKLLDLGFAGPPPN